MPLLEVRDVSVRFGGIVALDRVSFDVPEGAVVGLIGPNGAGKTTLFNTVSGLYRVDSGDLVFRGESLLGKPSHTVVRSGIARTFQNVELWPTMTVLDNVKIGTAHPSPTNSDDYVGTLLYFRFWDFLQGHEFRVGKFSIILVKNSGFHNLMKSKTGSNGA